MSGSAVKKIIEKTTHGLIGHLFSVITTSIPPPNLAPLLPLLSEYNDIFAEPTSLPPHRTLDHSIPLKTDYQPPNQRPYRCPYIQKGVMEQLVKEMLSSGIIQQSHNPFASLILLVKKKDNTWRFCVDYKRLNNITIKDKFPIPIVDELLYELQGFMVLSKLDLRAGYHQILLNPMDIYKTAFRTHHGHYEFKVMPFGLTNAPATFQDLMNEVFASYIWKFVLVFFDDILLEYLGHIITPSGVCADPTKIAAMHSWPLPTSIKELRGFLSLTGYYRKFVKNYGEICKPLTDLLRKNSFNWNAAATSAFEQLNLSMSTTPVLALPDFSKQFTVESDASETYLGVVLTQEGKQISFFISPLGPRVRALSTYEKEFLAIVKDILQSYVGDDKVQELITQLLVSSNSVPYYTYKSEILRYKNRIYVGASNGVRATILNTVHTSAIGGHSGIHATYVRAKSHFFWPKMKQEILLFVTECDICQRNKGECSFPSGLLQPLPVPKHAWQHITMDFIEGLPMSDMKSIILVVVDRLAKYIHFIALQHPYTAASVAKAFLDQVFKLHGLPSSIISDRDKVFTSHFWQDLFKALGTSLNLSTDYHPQTDGQSERVNSCLENYLRCITGHKPSKWCQWLSLAEWWYNTSYHTSLKFSPFQALYGYLPPHMAFPSDTTTFVAVVESYLKDTETMIDILKESLHNAQARMKFFADKTRKDMTVAVGDLVYLKLQPYRQAYVSLRKNFKLSAKFYGPFPILQRIGPVAYKLHLPDQDRIHPVFYVSQLKQHIGKKHTPSPTLPIVDHVGEVIMVPAKVLQQRTITIGRRQVQQVLIQWTNSTQEDATWEDVATIKSHYRNFILEDKDNFQQWAIS
ncbi:uncharacterized protein LOC113333611 [Papaver somniferum]|uniref:uncharacterized protein LOC113333611 n=1 Tax=Papaver somniferum TaxID=3469 RepID=UPI000E7037F6|nr:uncharacterized protein LOC113333611 [Papaver somniferum]